MRTALVSLAAIVAALVFMAPSAGAATAFVVNSSADTADGTAGDGVCDTDGGPGVGVCTLRAAIQQANAGPAPAPGPAPYTISLSGISGSTITPSSDLPAIEVDDTVIEGCASETTVGPCVGLRAATTGTGVGLDIVGDGVTVRSLAISRFDTGIRISGAGAIVRNSDFGLRIDHVTPEGMNRAVLVGGTGARIGGTSVERFNSFVDNADAILIWGGDSTEVAGNLVGLRRDTTLDPNARGIVVAGRTGVLPNGAIDEAQDTVIGGGTTYATDDQGAVCVLSCNRIAGSSVAGIELDGDKPDETPAAGLTISNNFLGLDGENDAAANAVAIHVGDGGKLVASDTAGAFISDNLIAGNSLGIDQTGGKGVLSVIANVFGLAPPDFDAGMPNLNTNAALGGDYGGRDALVAGNTFGATDKGIVLTGPQPCVGGNFFTPSVGTGTYATAAIVIEPAATDARIGNELGCFAGYSPRNYFGGTAQGAPAILVRGADDFSIVATFVGTLFAPPLAGPAVRIVDGPGDDASDGGQIGGDSPNLWNAFIRTSGPAIVIDGHATGIVVGGGEGKAINDFANSSSLWTDLLSIPGPDNLPTGQNGGAQPPVIGVATTAGIAGTGTPGATIRILQHWRADKPTDGIDEPYSEGYTLPPMGATTTVAPDGNWSLVFSEKLPEGQGVTASQTTALGSSEFAALRTATPAPPLPVAQITGGPSGTTTSLTATFTFTSPTPGATLECALDAGAFAPCTSPATYGPLETGGHQFRVQARVGDQVSLPVSRTWAIDAPLTPPAKTPPSATAAQRFAALVSLPSAKRCLSRRTIRLRIRKPGAAGVVYAQIRVTGKRMRTVSGRALNSAIDLRGLPKGTIKVRIRVLLSNGKVVSGTKTYRTCAKKKAKTRKKR